MTKDFTYTPTSLLLLSQHPECIKITFRSVCASCGKWGETILINRNNTSYCFRITMLKMPFAVRLNPFRSRYFFVLTFLRCPAGNKGSLVVLRKKKGEYETEQHKGIIWVLVMCGRGAKVQVEAYISMGDVNGRGR